MVFNDKPLPAGVNPDPAWAWIDRLDSIEFIDDQKFYNGTDRVKKELQAQASNNPYGYGINFL